MNRVTSEYLVSQGINDLVVALQSVANVNSWNQYGVYEYYSFRGFSDSVQMVDGIRNEGNRVRTQLSNVESVEILKGPASVLYGSEAVGGTLNIVLKKPSLQPAYEGAVSVGSWEPSAPHLARPDGWEAIDCCIASISGPIRPRTSVTILGPK